MLLKCGVGEDYWRVPCTARRSNQSNQSWIFTGRNDAEAPILWPPDVKNWVTGKDPDAGKDRRQEEKWATKDEMGGWHHRLNGHEFGWDLGISDGQGSLPCCSPWGCKESDMTEQLNSNSLTVRPCLMCVASAMAVTLLFISESAFISKYTLFPPCTKSGYLVGVALSLMIHAITDDASVGIYSNDSETIGMRGLNNSIREREGENWGILLLVQACQKQKQCIPDS